MNFFMRRIDVWRETERDAPAATARSVKECYDVSFATMSDPPHANASVPVRVHDADTIDLGLALVRSGAASRPLLLILADDCFPGGCVATGSGAQEEALFRRTNLCRVLSMSHYPIRDGEAVYAPGVVVFKNGERHATDPFGTMAEPAVLDFVACPGLRHPMLSSEGRLYEADELRLAIKIRTVLQVAARHGHDAVVLGALGCGAWKCPSRHVAEVFARELAVASSSIASFKRIDLAILKGTAAGYITITHADGSVQPDNYDVFADVLNDAFYKEIPCPRIKQ